MFSFLNLSSWSEIDARGTSMLPKETLNLIPSFKVRYLCQTYLEGVEARLGKHFLVYLKDFYIDEDEVEILVGYAPKPSTIIVSTYADFTKIPPVYTHGKTVLRVAPGKSEHPLKLSIYSLHRQITPNNHKLNLSTEIERVKITCRCAIDTRLIREGPYGTLMSALQSNAQ